MNHIEKGRKNEEIAARFLISKGHHILERNWRHRKKEVDIISQDGDRLVVTEVKTALPGTGHRHEYLIPPGKQKAVIQTGWAYLRQQDRFKTLRFDLVIVCHNRGGISLDHIEDAF